LVFSVTKATKTKGKKEAEYRKEEGGGGKEGGVQRGITQPCWGKEERYIGQVNTGEIMHHSGRQRDSEGG